MYRTKEKILTVFLTVLLLLALGGQAVAADPPAAAISGIVKPMWANIDSLSATLTFTGTRANCSGRAYGKVGTTMITGTAVLARLQNGVYTTVKTWSNLVSYSDTLMFDGTYYVTAGYTYRLAFTATVYIAGSAETATVYSSAYCA